MNIHEVDAGTAHANEEMARLDYRDRRILLEMNNLWTAVCRDGKRFHGDGNLVERVAYRTTFTSPNATNMLGAMPKRDDLPWRLRAIRCLLALLLLRFFHEFHQHGMTIFVIAPAKHVVHDGKFGAARGAVVEGGQIRHVLHRQFRQYCLTTHSQRGFAKAALQERYMLNIIFSAARGGDDGGHSRVEFGVAQLAQFASASRDARFIYPLESLRGKQRLAAKGWRNHVLREAGDDCLIWTTVYFGLNFRILRLKGFEAQGGKRIVRRAQARGDIRQSIMANLVFDRLQPVANLRHGFVDVVKLLGDLATMLGESGNRFPLTHFDQRPIQRSRHNGHLPIELLRLLDAQQGIVCLLAGDRLSGDGSEAHPDKGDGDGMTPTDWNGNDRKSCG
ncbi:hypothetical protein RBI14_21020 [Alcaligenaceae bacterium B3P038]|nr:hypothetical protein [Alcaligenaceae bacterium B3P038]